MVLMTANARAEDVLAVTGGSYATLPGAPTAIVESSAAEPGRKNSARPSMILRFHRAEILLHWAIAVPFVLCFLTALVLAVVYYSAPLRPYRDLFSWTHRISGVCLLVLPALVLAIHWRDWRRHLSNIRVAWVWTLDDVKWLFLIGPSMLGRKVPLPEEGKFNAGEKLNFIMVMTSIPLLGVTGIVIWASNVAYSSWLAHFFLGLAAFPLMAGHIFLATILPSTRTGLSGMVGGRVDRDWASHHYRRWYRENFGTAAFAPTVDPTETPASGSPRHPDLVHMQDSEPASVLGPHEASVSTLPPAGATVAEDLKHPLPAGLAPQRQGGDVELP
jgi:formate dehydrogenase subunit gamma